MIRIVLTGAESSGKSTLTSYLAAHFQLPFALEYARHYLELHGPHYDYEIVHEIARRHLDFQAQQVPVDAPIGIFDTDLLNFSIWCEVAFSRCEPWLSECAASEMHHVYLLCRPDIPWEADPLREFPEERDALFEKHLEAVRRSGRDYEMIGGDGAERQLQARQAVGKLMMRAGLEMRLYQP